MYMGMGRGRVIRLYDSGPPIIEGSDEEWNPETGFKGLLEHLGYNGHPTIMSEEDFRAFIEEHGLTEQFRGIGGDSAEILNEYIAAFESGDFYVDGAEMYFGQGMYATSSEEAAGFWAERLSDKGVVMNFALTPDARVVDYGDLARMKADFAERNGADEWRIRRSEIEWEIEDEFDSLTREERGRLTGGTFNK